MNLDLKGSWTKPDTEQVMSGAFATGRCTIKIFGRLAGVATHSLPLPPLTIFSFTRPLFQDVSGKIP